METGIGAGVEIDCAKQCEIVVTNDSHCQCHYLAFLESSGFFSSFLVSSESSVSRASFAL